MRKFISLLFVFLAVGFLACCDKDDSGEIAVTAVSIEPGTADIKVGEIKQLVATVLSAEATDKSITWTSSSDAVATVSDAGLVTAITEGTATITATAGEKTSTCVITVSKDEEVLNLETIFSGTLTVMETGSGTEYDYWTDVDIPVAEVVFVEKQGDSKFLFNIKGFWYPQMEVGEYKWLKDGQSTVYPNVPVLIDITDPENPTYTVGQDEGNDYIAVNVTGTDEYWMGFKPQSNKAIEIDYEGKTMVMEYSVIGGADWINTSTFTWTFSWE